MLSTWSRYLVLWSCRLLGAVYGVLRRRVVVHAILLLLIAGALALADALFPAAAPAAKPTAPAAAVKPWLTLWNVLSVWAAGLVVGWVVQARRRLFIGAFEDFSGKQAGVDAQGFGILLASELARLGALFNEFDEGRTIQSIPEKLTPLNASFQTESVGQFLERAVSAESAFQVGPFKMPVGVVLGLVGRLVQGPRLTGQIHRDGEQRIVTIGLVGSRGERSWSVSETIVKRDGDKVVWRPSSELAHELACRIFADVEIGGAITWSTLVHFAAGVRAYRQSLRTPRRRMLQLQDAEHRLLQAIAEDPRFDLAYYDLAVVYGELGKLDASGVALTRAITENNQRWSPYYALALNSYARARGAFATEGHEAAGILYLSKALDHCEQARQLASGPTVAAQILSLKASVLWWRGWRMGPDAAATEFRRAGAMARRAVWHGWRALCAAEVGIGVVPARLAAARQQGRLLASRYLQDFASMALASAQTITRLGAMAGGPGPALHRFQQWLALRATTHALEQARTLTPTVTRIYLDLGAAYLMRERWTAAARTLETAAQLDPASAEAWGFLALARARRGQRTLAREAAQRVFANMHSASKESLEAVGRAMRVLEELLLEIRGASGRVSKLRETRFPLWRMVRWVVWYVRTGFRLADRSPLNLRQANQRLPVLLRNDAELAAAIAWHEATAERAERHHAFVAEVSALRAKPGGSGIEDLKKLLAAKREAGHSWEAAEAGAALTNLLVESNRSEEGEACLRETIGHLERTLHGEIQRRGLYAQLSRILRQREKYVEALAEAKKGVAVDPVSAYERIELGWVYLNLTELPAARAAWDEALLLAGDHAQLNVSLAFTILRQLNDETDRVVRSSLLDQAARHLSAALALYGDDNPGRHGARFHLARVYFLAGRYIDAVRELVPLDSSKQWNEIVSLDLADAYLAGSEPAEAEKIFRRAAGTLQARRATAARGVNDEVESPLGDNVAVGAALAFAHLGVAASLADREIDLGGAMIEVERAQEALKDVADDETRQLWTARCTFHEGVLLAKMGRTDDAIAKLESALARLTDAAQYVALAGALLDKAERDPKLNGRAGLLRRASQYYEEARRRDWNADSEDKIAKGLARAAALGRQPS